MAFPDETGQSRTVRLTPEDADRSFEPVRDWTARHLPTGLVPQADDLDRLFKLVEVVRDREEITAQALDVVHRQVNYYKHAARLLGLMNRNDSLTTAGEQLGRMNREQRLAATAVHFESSECGSRWVQWAKAHTLGEVDPESAEAFLSEWSELTGQTVGRRAKTLKGWLTTLLPFHYSTYQAQEND